MADLGRRSMVTLCGGGCSTKYVSHEASLSLYVGVGLHASLGADGRHTYQRSFFLWPSAAGVHDFEVAFLRIQRGLGACWKRGSSLAVYPVPMKRRDSCNAGMSIGDRCLVLPCRIGDFILG